MKAWLMSFFMTFALQCLFAALMWNLPMVPDWLVAVIAWPVYFFFSWIVSKITGRNIAWEMFK